MPSAVSNDPPMLFSLNGEGIVAPQSVANRMLHNAAIDHHTESLTHLSDSFVAGGAFLTARALGASPATQEAALRLGANVAQFGVALGGRALPPGMRGASPAAPKTKPPRIFEKPYKPGAERARMQHDLYKTELGRWMEKPVAREPTLAKKIDKLFREGGETRNGSTASALRYERQTGQPVKEKFHETKARDAVIFLDRWLKANPAATNDYAVAQALRSDLLDALQTPAIAGYFAAVRAYKGNK